LGGDGTDRRGSEGGKMEALKRKRRYVRR